MQGIVVGLMRLLFALTIAVAAMAGIGNAGSAVAVIDGDTIVVGGRSVQLYGIDAPELGQRCRKDGLWETCGLRAAFELAKLLSVEHRPVRCQPFGDGGKSAGEMCHVGSIDAAAFLLESGYVMTTADADDHYRALAAAARRVPLGIWQSEFTLPADWRAGHRLAGEAVEQPCPVKAVVAATGARVYYVPTDADYAAVEVDPSGGDRRYCSDEAARADGWLWAGVAGAN